MLWITLPNKPFPILAVLVFVLSVPASATARIAGTGVIEGEVTAGAPFTAAKVLLTHVDKDILYVVYTERGHYKAVNLFPGEYEVTVDKRGFATRPKTVNVTAEGHETLDFSLKVVDAQPLYVGSKVLRDTYAAPYEAIYPPGRGREIIENTCIVCHGVNFVPAMSFTKEGWGAVVERMTNGHAFGNPANDSQFAPERLIGDDREILIDYLAKNFGVGSPKRAVRVEMEPELDEQALGKAMFMKYNFANTKEMPDRYTQEPHFDSQGNVWVAQPAKPGSIIRLDPRTGEYKDYPTPDPRWTPHSIAVDKDDSVWYTGGGTRVAHLDPATGNLDLYPVLEMGEHGIAVVLDSKGDAWFTALQSNKIGHWDRETDKVQMYESPSPRGRPYGMLVDQEDNIWFAQFHACIATRFDPRTKRFTEFPALSQPCMMRRFGLDSKGYIWYGLWNNAHSKEGKIGRIDPKSGATREFTLPLRYSNPYDTWVDNDDNVWISSDNYLVKFEQQTERFTFFPLVESRTDVPKFSVTRENALWYTPRGYSISRGGPAAVAVLYPDKEQMTTFGAFYSENAVENRIRKYGGPNQPVRNTAPEIIPNVPEFYKPSKRDTPSSYEN